MGRIDRTVLWILVGVVFLGVGAAGVYFANDWWLSGIMTVSIVAWLTGVLAAIYGRPERRAVIVGAVLASFLYILFAVGPWFRANVGPWLLTSQALAQIETKLLGRQPQAQQLTYAAVPSPPPSIYGSGYVVQGIPQVATSPTYTLVSTFGPSANPSFLMVGHWLFGWIAAAAGALAAAWMTRRNHPRRPTSPEPEP